MANDAKEPKDPKDEASAKAAAAKESARRASVRKAMARLKTAFGLDDPGAALAIAYWLATDGAIPSDVEAAGAKLRTPIVWSQIHNANYLGLARALDIAGMRHVPPLRLQTLAGEVLRDAAA